MLKHCAFDAETHLISPHNTLAPPPVCWSFCLEGQEPSLMANHDNMLPKLLENLINDNDMVLIGHNVAFDLALAVKYHEIDIATVLDKLDKGLIKDTMIREKLIQIADGTVTQMPSASLAAVVLKYLGEDRSESKKGDDVWRLRYEELEHYAIENYPAEAAAYAKQDAEDTYNVFMAQVKFEELFKADELRQTRAAFDLHMIALHSPHIDAEEVRQLRWTLQQKVEDVEKRAADMGFLRWNPKRYVKHFPEPKDPRAGGWSEASTKIKQAVKEEAEMYSEKPQKTEKGAISIKAEVLQSMRHPTLRAYGEVKEHKKVLDSFVPALEQAAPNRILTSYDVLKSTGRTSSYGGTSGGINIQQMPRAAGCRECFVPSSRDNCFAAIDYTAFEMCALAQAMYEEYGATAMKEAIDAGQDLHTATAAKLNGETYEDMAARIKDGDQFAKDMRQASKAFNFGVPGGMGAEKFITTLTGEQKEILQSLSPSEPLTSILKPMIHEWKLGWDALEYFDIVARQTRKGRDWAYTHPYSGRVRSGLQYSDGLNIKFQGRCADAAKNALRRLSDDMYRITGALASYDVTACAFMHDEVLFEGPTLFADEWAPRAASIMVEAAQEVIPDVKIRAEPEIMRVWQKEGTDIATFSHMLSKHRGRPETEV